MKNFLDKYGTIPLGCPAWIFTFFLVGIVFDASTFTCLWVGFLLALGIVIFITWEYYNRFRGK